MSEREQRALLKVTGEHRTGFRDHCLYAMALGTGLREHELIALSVGDVFREGRPRRRLLLSVFKGAGKAGGTQEVRTRSADDHGLILRAFAEVGRLPVGGEQFVDA